MESPRKHPRTMQEAFGPYTSSTLHPKPDPAQEQYERRLDRIMLWLAACVTAWLVVSCMGGN